VPVWVLDDAVEREEGEVCIEIDMLPLSSEQETRLSDQHGRKAPLLHKVRSGVGEEGVALQPTSSRQMKLWRVYGK